MNAAADWWWVNDEAPRYCEREGVAAFYTRHRGKRIFGPDAGGDGGEVLEWLGRTRD